jgi:hypothetical protein
MSSVHSSIDRHPDLLALRESYSRAAESTITQGTFGLTLLTGVYVALSPWIIGFHTTTGLAVNDLIVGLVVAVLAFAFGSALDRTHGMTWTLPLFGLWVVFAPAVLRGVSATTGVVWSQIGAGAVLTFLGCVAAFYGMRSSNTR